MVTILINFFRVLLTLLLSTPEPPSPSSPRIGSGKAAQERLTEHEVPLGFKVSCSSGSYGRGFRVSGPVQNSEVKSADEGRSDATWDVVRSRGGRGSQDMTAASLTATVVSNISQNKLPTSSQTEGILQDSKSPLLSSVSCLIE